MPYWKQKLAELAQEREVQWDIGKFRPKQVLSELTLHLQGSHHSRGTVLFVPLRNTCPGPIISQRTFRGGWESTGTAAQRVVESPCLGPLGCGSWDPSLILRAPQDVPFGINLASQDAVIGIDPRSHPSGCGCWD